MTIGSIALGLEEDDDLFARPPRAVARQEAKQAHITCRVCDRPATVPLDHPALLCEPCMTNLDGTRDRVAEWLGKSLERLDANQADWDALRFASPAADRWPAIQGALIAVAERRAKQEDLDRTWAKRKAEGGPLAALLLAYDAYAREADRIGDELNRIYAAQREINTAFLSEEL